MFINKRVKLTILNCCPQHHKCLILSLNMVYKVVSWIFIRANSADRSTLHFSYPTLTVITMLYHDSFLRLKICAVCHVQHYFFRQYNFLQFSEKHLHRIVEIEINKIDFFRSCSCLLCCVCTHLCRYYFCWPVLHLQMFHS